jgi:hypothetical protein
MGGGQSSQSAYQKEFADYVVSLNVIQKHMSELGQKVDQKDAALVALSLKVGQINQVYAARDRYRAGAERQAPSEPQSPVKFDMGGQAGGGGYFMNQRKSSTGRLSPVEPMDRVASGELESRDAELPPATSFKIMESDEHKVQFVKRRSTADSGVGALLKQKMPPSEDDA